MPEMDGFEATRQIRAWQRSSSRAPPLPIVALTANALTGDREACITAGMSDYLAKPITGSNLAAMLARHLGTLGAATLSSCGTPQSGGATRAQRSVFDTSVLASLPMVADGSHRLGTFLTAKRACAGRDRTARLSHLTAGGRMGNTITGTVCVAPCGGAYETPLGTGPPAAVCLHRSK